MSSNPEDIDGDNIPNKWEDNGIDINNDGKIDMNLSARHASSSHKDLFLEIDYMKGHQPYAQVIPNITKSFRNAPVCNPDGKTGIKLHVQLDQQIPEKKLIKMWKDFDDLYDNYFGTSKERKNPNFNAILDAKSMIYHYAIFGHTYDDTSTPEDDSWSSGMSDLPGMSILVSLGKFSPDKSGHGTGTPQDQEGTLMHEFGHNLGLDHGGEDNKNCKPNYISVMNYAFQFPDPIANRPLDFSRSSLLPLNESSLNESAGVSQSAPPRLITVYGPSEMHTTVTGEPVDWNTDSDFRDTGLKDDVNYINEIYDCNKHPNDLLTGYDDWNHLVYDYAIQKEGKDGQPELIVFPSNISNSDFSSSLSSVENKSRHSLLHNQSNVSQEMTYNDIKNMNLKLVSSISNSIGNLSNMSMQQNSKTSKSFPSDQNESNIENAKKYYADKIGNINNSESALSTESRNVNDTTITGYIKTDKIINAIFSLNDLLPTMDSSFGGTSSDDKIVDSTAQQDISDQIKNTIEILKTQSCNYSNCTIIDKTPDETIEY